MKIEDIDIPDFMKNRNKHEESKTEQKELEKAYIKGGIHGVLTTLAIIGAMVFIAIIENI